LSRRREDVARLTRSELILRIAYMWPEEDREALVEELHLENPHKHSIWGQFLRDGRLAAIVATLGTVPRRTLLRSMYNVRRGPL